MRLYYQVQVFDQKRRFVADELENMIRKGRKYFFLYFERVTPLKEVISFQRFLDKHKDLFFCIHDKNLIVPDNEINIGRNVAFYNMLARSGAQIENVSFHMGSLIGFGKEKNDLHHQSLMQYKLPKELNGRRFLIANFTADRYIKYYNRAVKCVHNISEIFRENEIDFLIKNVSLEHVISSKKKSSYFENLGYTPSTIGEDTLQFPIMVEKGDFPKTINEILDITQECGIRFSLDMEHLHNLILFSGKYHINNEELTRRMASASLFC